MSDIVTELSVYLIPCDLARGLGILPLRSREEKRLAGRFVLVCSFKENSSLLITFILILRFSFSFRLWVKCRRRVSELSENNWMISATAAFTSTFIMDKSCDSMFMLPPGMFVDMFWFDAAENCVRIQRDTVCVLATKTLHNGLPGLGRRLP